jgi:hypothetical protein
VVVTVPVVTVDGDEAIAIVRNGPETVHVTLSAKHGADIEVSLRPTECEVLIRALQRAVAHARGTKGAEDPRT